MRKFGRDIANLIGSFLGPSLNEIKSNQQLINYWLHLHKPLSQLGKADCIQYDEVHLMIIWIRSNPLNSSLIKISCPISEIFFEKYKNIILNQPTIWIDELTDIDQLKIISRATNIYKHYRVWIADWNVTIEFI